MRHSGNHLCSGEWKREACILPIFAQSCHCNWGQCLVVELINRTDSPREVSDWHCWEVWTSMKGSKWFCSSEIPLPHTLHLRIYFFWCHRNLPSSWAGVGVLQRKQTNKRVCLQISIPSKWEQWKDKIQNLKLGPSGIFSIVFKQAAASFSCEEVNRLLGSE